MKIKGRLQPDLLFDSSFFILLNYLLTEKEKTEKVKTK